MQKSLLPATERLTPLRAYINETWNTLTRSLRHVLEATLDEKTGPEDVKTKHVLYLPSRENRDAVARRLQKMLPAAERRRIELAELPSDWRHVEKHGLLYLPGRYVVPGGRFNEMHGWDSYFIILGLLRSGREGLATSMADQLLYQVEHYGTVLNANRTYFLTRSHPPLLGRAVLAVYAATGDLDWLRAALPLVEKYYFYWTVPPHQLPSLGLSRYFDHGEGPCTEVVASELDANGLHHYDRIIRHFREAASGSIPDRDLYYDAAADTLTPHAWKCDRSMRESGFDPSDRFGPFNLDCISYAPVCLNTLLWRLEMDIAEIRDLLDATATRDAWLDRAHQRREIIDRFLWDAASGQYSDWHTGRNARSGYAFLTTFWPLWAGLASREQAAAVAAHLPSFETGRGLTTSQHRSGCQWDAPFTWAPLVYMAALGLRSYGYGAEARRIAAAFVETALSEFERTGFLYEKYDSDCASSETCSRLLYGYTTNEPGFGWTNACLLELLELLGEKSRPRARRRSAKADESESARG